ncbi:serine hydrolase domain-containing protein [Flagellimonas zhangzhouensis]|uniref:CubicO group peptidase, beta-lactamase class C family n=1 Tax=Flagellimonas zhangzhouensis TaxID=1073328 RepID=A0A1H2X612_9FLAO|nr:serine hydrolase domain-containing protein [Allomuricauda zhangzhouensis]SDQ28529.1 CubicO group peptidase, beta-lactamase class C family [Allomuricauda zhangzhouensis]SDW88332.1 CubicO group peptidase, beta-lactamase class C family [Allomuricauda zhangzhouensis]
MTTKHPIPFKVLFIALFLQVFTYAQELAKVPAEQVGMSSERLAYLTSTFQEYVDQNRLPGASILVARKGKIAYFETFGKNDIVNNVPMTEGSIFRIASQTKAIVSVGVMILQERGKLLITDQVGKFMPAFQKTKVAVRKDDGGYDIVDAERPITIRDLLTHTSGVSYGSGISANLWEKAGIQGWYFADREEPIQATINRMGDLPFEAQPGEKFEYGYNTDILGALIEVVSGEPLDVFLKKNILEPLGMTDTHFYLPEAKRARLAVVYSPTENGLEPAPTPGGMVGQGAYVDGPRTSFSGGAGLLSTSMDYAKFLQMMLNKGVFNGNRILSRKSVELMTVNHLGKAQFPWVGGTGFGLGFSVVEDLGDLGTLGSVGEYGWGGAYHSSYWVDHQEEMVVVYFTQLIPSGDIDDHGKLRALIYQAIVD